MLTSIKSNSSPTRFTLVWLIIAVFITMQIIYIVLCHSMANDLQQAMPDQQRIIIRSIFYAIAIITFPLTRLIRHICIRLNQTMPGNKSAYQRYLISVIISQAIMESIGTLGFVMFILGDDFNTLYLFTGLALLGFFLYRPKQEEFATIVQALNSNLIER